MKDLAVAVLRLLPPETAHRVTVELAARFAPFLLPAPKDDPRLAGLLNVVKERESLGYAYEAAGASFELLARRSFGEVPDFFDVESFRVMVERRHNARGEMITVSDAIVKVRIGGELLINAGEGNGPVHALDQALRSLKEQGRISDFVLEPRPAEELAALEADAISARATSCTVRRTSAGWRRASKTRGASTPPRCSRVPARPLRPPA